MKDQVAAHRDKGLKAGCVTGESTPEEKSEVVKGNFQLVFFSPESLLSGHRCRELLRYEPYRTNIVALLSTKLTALRNGEYAC